MPKKPKNESFRTNHFTWRLFRRGRVWYADGRKSSIKITSLHATDRSEAEKNLALLDETIALERGIIDRRMIIQHGQELTIATGRKLYEDHIGRPEIIGGVRPGTKPRYASSLNKFCKWATNQGISTFNLIDTKALNRFVAFLETRNLPKTILNDVITIKSCINYLINEGHLVGAPPIKLNLATVESEKAYCYRMAEVRAMVELCKTNPHLQWLENIIIGLACTGARIGELANLKWADIVFDPGFIHLVDETGKSTQGKKVRRLKNRSSRMLPLHAELRAVLVKTSRRDEYVFHDDRKRQLDAEYVRNALVDHILTPLSGKFPSKGGERSLIDGRLHSFRHYFISACAINKVPERVVMEWVGHAHSKMIRHYFQLHDEDSQTYMNNLNLLGAIVGRSSDAQEGKSSIGGNTEPA